MLKHRKHLHAVEAAALGGASGILNLKLVGNVDVQVTLVLVVGAVLQDTRDGFTLLDGEDIAQVEDGLLPMCVLGVRAGGEADRLVASAELDIEPRNESVNEVGTVSGKLVRHLEGKVGGSDGVEVESDDLAGLGNQSLHLDGVNQGLGEGNLLHGAVVEAVDVVPDWNHFLAQYIGKQPDDYSHPILSSLYSPSSMAATYMVALSGKILPSSAR